MIKEFNNWLSNNTFLFYISFAIIYLGFLCLKELYKIGKKKKCQQCGKLFATKIIKSTLLGEFESSEQESYLEETGEYEIVNKEEKSILRPIKSTKYRDVEITMYEYNNTQVCKYCGTKSTFKSCRQANMKDHLAKLEELDALQKKLTIKAKKLQTEYDKNCKKQMRAKSQKK
jgi:hypothetical protein